MGARTRFVAFLLAAITLLALGAWGCGRWGGSTTTQPEAKMAVAREAAAFCAPGNGDVVCEDFTHVAEGALPNGWLGGEGLLVKSSDRLRGKPVLTPFEPRPGYLVQIPWALKGDFLLEMHVLPCASEWECAHDKNSFTIRMGALEATIGNLRGTYGDCEVKVALGNSEAPIPGSDACGFDKLFHVVAIERTGHVWKLSYDGAPKVVARYDVPAPDAIALLSTERGFTLAGIRVRNLTKKASSDAGAALACPTACKEDEVCSRGACTRLCPFDTGHVEPAGVQNNRQLFREFKRTEPGCDGGPCVWDFSRATGIPLDILEPNMTRLGCKRRAAGDACCPSPPPKAPSSSAATASESASVITTCSLETDAMMLTVRVQNGRLASIGGRWFNPKSGEHGPVLGEGEVRDAPFPEATWVDLTAAGDDVESSPKFRVRVTGAKMEVEGHAQAGICTTQ